VFCQSGEISEEIVELLSDAGYTAYNLTGGYREYFRECLS
jgi:rhodanese-related sulfurtransferase